MVGGLRLVLGLREIDNVEIDECYLVRINYKEAHDFDLTQIGNVKRLIADLEIIVLEMLYLLEIDNV